MPLLDAAGLARAARKWMAENDQPVSVTKDDIRAAIAAIDAQRDADWSRVNAAIALPTRTALTRKQKARMLAVCIEEAFRLE